MFGQTALVKQTLRALIFQSILLISLMVACSIDEWATVDAGAQKSTEKRRKFN